MSLKRFVDNKRKQLKYVLKRRYVPRLFHIETTNICNARCVMCPHEKMKRERGHMSWELFAKIIDECKAFKIGNMRIHLHKDGEPLLDPMLPRRIEYVKKNLPWATVQFNSNAMALDEDKTNRLLNSGVDRIVFSVDGASRETYEQIRKGLKYDVVKSNIEKFLERKKNTSIIVTMQMVVCENNRHEIKLYQDLWSGKADRVVFKAMHNFLDMSTSIRTGELRKNQVGFCDQPFKTMLIYRNGDVGLCCWDYDNFADLGNVTGNSLVDVYNNEKFRTIRAAMVKMDCGDIVPCNRCSQIYGQDMRSTRVKDSELADSQPSSSRSLSLCLKVKKDFVSPSG